MMDDRSAAGSTASDKFFRHFQGEFEDITQKIKELETEGAPSDDKRNAAEQCQARITQLSNEVRDATSYIPAHDRRLYGEGIKDLQQKLKSAQAAVAPRQKFSFKSSGLGFAAKKTDGVGSTQDALRKRQPDHLSGLSKRSNSMTGSTESSTQASAVRSQQLPTSDDNSSTIRNRNNEHIIFPPSSGSGTLSMLQNCVIDMTKPSATGKSFANLTLKEIRESLIICGNIEGPVHLTDISNSLIVVSSRQFRMHDSRECLIYLHTSSRPIIEDSTAIKFAPLPDIYRTEGNGQTNEQWQEVDDFNWHRSEPSPNWSMLDVSQRLADDVWRDVSSDKQSIGLEEILQMVSLPK